MTFSRMLTITTPLITSITLLLIIILLGGCAQNNIPTSDLEVLDSNRDGTINPYEALDALLVMEKENGKPLTPKDIADLALAQRNEQEKEMAEMFSKFDKNNDGTIVLSEVDEKMADFAQMLESDQDGSVTHSEMMAFDFASDMLSSEKEIEVRVKETFEELDANHDRGHHVGASCACATTTIRTSRGEHYRDAHCTRIS